MAKKKRYKKKKNTASKADITVVVLMIISILLAVLIYTKSGVVGAKLNEIKTFLSLSISILSINLNKHDLSTSFISKNSLIILFICSSSFLFLIV